MDVLRVMAIEILVREGRRWNNCDVVISNWTLKYVHGYQL